MNNGRNSHTARFVVLLMTAILLAGAVLYLIISRDMLAKYAAIEAEQVSVQMERGVAAVERQLDHLQSAAGDYAVWDETYAFIEHPRPEYLRENLLPATFVELGIDYMVFLGPAGSVVHARAVDRAALAERPFPEELLRLIAEGVLFGRLAREDERLHGIGLLGGDPVLLGARSILRSDGSGPARGAVIFGRRIDEGLRAQLAQTVGFELSSVLLASGEVPAAVRSALGRTTPAPPLAVPSDAQWIDGYAAMRDLNGEPVFVLSGRFPRTIYARGLESRLYLLLTFLVTGLSLGLIAAALTARLAAEARERARADEALWIRNRALDSALSGVALAGLDGALTYVNASLVAMWGYRDAGELVGRPAVSFWAQPEQAEQVIAAVGAAGEWDGELEARRCDGTTFPAHLLAALVRDRDGRPVAMFGSFVDVSERRRAMAELAAARQRLEFVVANSPVVIYTCRPEGDYGATFVSANIEAMLGYRPEAMTSDGGFWASRIHPEDAPRVFAELPKLFTTGHHAHDYRFRHKDGSWRWMHDDLRLIRDASGTPVEILGSWLDVTDRRRATEERLELERRLLHAQKLESLGVLAGGIAHDFNNLLMAVLGNLDLALLSLPPGAEERPFLEKSVQAVNRAAGLTQQMLAFAGSSAFVVEKVDLAALVRESVEFFRASVQKTVTFALHVPQELPRIMADASQVQQVVLNLITNAAEAIGDAPGSVTLTIGAREFGAEELAGSRCEVVLAPGRFVWLEVADSGCGMDREALERLFDPFFTTKFTGRGLGMASVLGIVRSHQGAIFVESDPGRGTVVRVLFPVATAAGPAPGEETAAAAATAPARARPEAILLVDDEPAVLEVCRDMLASDGWRVLAARDGREAVEVFSAHAAEVGVAVLDLSMPGMDGVATMRELRRIRPDVRVILTSGYAEPEATARLADRGSAVFVQKPYTLEKLRAALGRVAAGQNPTAGSGPPAGLSSS